ncbi:hypothetical protein M413DRAFT_7794 [Hebeloma cylindrosporum]|uniref:Galectin domain-containing protein n=1 Tax=Hebeloma cylindrosporum TaxID=76867 RepID=A0A0C3CT43_HEBCY|nr:hypothetical protein M413DRAFT_7794 [Hebeloma cylindrosporum h7]
MSSTLQKGMSLAGINFSEGMIIAFKSTVFDLAKTGLFKGGAQETYLDLYNGCGDIVLSIMIRRGENKAFFNDRAAKSLVDGWGQTQSVDLSPEDVERWKRGGVTISVHDCSTRSEKRYQILFDLTTICFFAKRFPGAVEKVLYDDRFAKTSRSQSQLSDSLKVFFYKLEDLAAEERQVIVSGRVESEIPDLGSAVISVTPIHFIPNQPYASIVWDNGKEIRIYYLGRGNILEEYAYSKDNDGWSRGELHKLRIILNETSTIAATFHDNAIYVFYQGRCHKFPAKHPKTDFINMVAQEGPTKEWDSHPPITLALPGTGIAVVGFVNPTGQYALRVYYQDPELYLREHWFDHSIPKWVLENNQISAVGPKGGAGDQLRKTVTRQRQCNPRMGRIDQGSNVQVGLLVSRIETRVSILLLGILLYEGPFNQCLVDAIQFRRASQQGPGSEFPREKSSPSKLVNQTLVRRHDDENNDRHYESA